MRLRTKGGSAKHLVLSAGMKAFVVNRVGDWGFICGMALLFWGLGGAWLADTGEFLPDFRSRFIAVEKEALPHGHGAHGADAHGADAHGADAHGADAHGADAHGADAKGHAPEGAGHGQGVGHDHAGHDHAGHDHAAPKKGPARPRAAQRGAAPRGPIPQRPNTRTTAAELAQRSGLGSYLTMTSHAGARVYFGVSSLEEVPSAKLPNCATLPSWHSQTEPALSTQCFAEPPFVRKRIHAGLHSIAIEPGGGAVVSGDGHEYAAVRMRAAPGKETVLMPVGPSLTFREIHDQLQVKDSSGKMFLRDALISKTVWGIALITLACLCFFVGATGKSAQLPLYTWLPDAMAGPTPVSALIHAATMVTAGVYMIARMNFLFSLSPAASGTVALVGALTALFAATIGFFQYDIKRVLAYSTVSQLGFMFIGVGVGAYWAAVFHLMTHAFFKACLFLGSGSVIHGMHHVIHDEDGAQDMRNMGGLRPYMPWTARTYLVACLAITAAPIPFFAGFWSKDEILWKSFNTLQTGPIPGGLIYIIGLVAALGTSFYMWRSYYLTFEGVPVHKDIPKKVHESPGAMVNVLIILAVLSTVSGVFFGFSSHFVGGHGEPFLEEWLHPVMAHSSAKIGNAGLLVEYILMAISVLGAVGMWGLAVVRYGAGRNRDWEARERRLSGFHLLHNKYFVDEIYDATVVKAFLKLRLVFAEMDRWIIDGLVNGVGVLGRSASWITGAIDKYFVDGAVNFVANGTLAAGNKLRTMQTGRVQNYIYGILGGVAFFAIVQYLLG
jgi:NADH-quinone oxidoreductase subunit L